MPYNHRTKLLFVHIPKTAGTSITEYFGFQQGKENCFVLNQKNKKPVAYHHMTPEQLVKYRLLTEETLLQSLSFCFVRNPFDRLVSEFHYRSKEHVADSHVQEYFSEFVNKIGKYIFLRRWNPFDNHLRPQWHFLNYKKKRVIRYVFRYEKLETELEKMVDIVRKESGININPSKLPHLRKSRRAPYQDYYDSKTRLMVGKWYAEDLQTLNYSF